MSHMAEKNSNGHSKSSSCLMCAGAHSWEKVSPLRLLILFLLLIAAFWIGVKFGQISVWGGYNGMPMMRGWGFGSYPGYYYMGPGMMNPWYYDGIQPVAATSSKR